MLLESACVRAYLDFADLALSQMRLIDNTTSSSTGSITSSDYLLEQPSQCLRIVAPTEPGEALAALRRTGAGLLALDVTLPRGGTSAGAAAALAAGVATALARSRRVCAVRLRGFAALAPRLLDALARASGLADLAVTDTDALRAPALAALAPARLVRLDVRNTRFDGAGLARFPRLAELCVARCDALAPELFYRSVAALPHLAALDLSDTRAPLDPAALAALLARAPRLRRLALAGCPALALPALLRVSPAAHLRALAALDIARCHAAPDEARSFVTAWLPSSAVCVLNVAHCSGLTRTPLARLSRDHGGNLDTIVGLDTLPIGSSSSFENARGVDGRDDERRNDDDGGDEGTDDDDYLPC